jgi:hypothetical protein
MEKSESPRWTVYQTPSAADGAEARAVSPGSTGAGAAAILAIDKNCRANRTAMIKVILRMGPPFYEAVKVY